MPNPRLSRSMGVALITNSEPPVRCGWCVHVCGSLSFSLPVLQGYLQVERLSMNFLRAATRRYSVMSASMIFSECSPFTNAVVSSMRKLYFTPHLLPKLPALYGAFFNLVYAVTRKHWQTRASIIQDVSFSISFLFEISFDSLLQCTDLVQL